MKLIFIDTETSGLDPKINSLYDVSVIIEIDGIVKAEQSFIFKPWRDSIWDPDLLKVEHDGVLMMPPEKREQIDSLQYSNGAAYKDFISLLSKYINRYDKKDKFNVLGYNIQFDVGFLREWFRQNADPYYGSWFHTNSICIMSLAGYVLAPVRHKMPNFKLQTLLQLFDLEPGAAHDGMDDIIATRALFNKIKRDHLTVKHIE